MKAFELNKKYYEVVEIRGNYIYGKDNGGKIKCVLNSSVEIVEIESLPKLKKYTTKKKVEVKVDPIQTWKDIALSVNDKWNSNSTWKFAEQEFSKINAKGNSFIESLLDSMFMKDRLSEKQAYYLAKYGVENGYLN